jgi:hypothetical protein
VRAVPASALDAGHRPGAVAAAAGRGAGLAEQLVRRGRIAFWRSCGLGLLPVPGYVMPDLTGAGPEPMLLMAAPPCAGAELRRLVRGVYAGRYGLAAADPLVRRALASVAD